jgi:5'-nucleotidase
MVFHGEKVREDSETRNYLEPLFKNIEPQKKRVVGQAVRPVRHTRTRESEMGNLISDAIRAKVHADFALVNAGGIRSEFESGPITYESLFRAFPFDNAVAVLKVSGQELKKIVRLAENGSRGFFPVSGLKLRLVDLAFEAPAQDLNQNKRIEPWEVDRLISVQQESGKPILDEKTYTLALPDFLVTGGDDMGWAMSQIRPKQVQLDAGGLMRDALEQYLAQAGPINSAEHPLVDPKHPRMKIEQPKKGKRSRRRRG